jgi:hypothetical protein
VQALAEGESGIMVGYVNGKVTRTPLPEVLKPVIKVKPELLKLKAMMER